jgi:hypothetical protein
MNTPCVLSKINKSKDIYLINENKRDQNNNSFSKNELFFQNL